MARASARSPACAGGVRVDVVDVGRRQPGQLDRAGDGVTGPLAARVRLDDVVAVGRDGRAHQPGQDGGAARLGVFLGLDEHQRAGLAEHHAVAIGVERAAGAGRIVVVGRQPAQVENAATGTASMRVSTPPQIAMSASPSTMACHAWAMAAAPEASAITGEMIPALASRSSPTAAAGALGMYICTASGLTPRACRFLQSS